MIWKICLISYKLKLGLQGESVDGQEAIEGLSIDQLYGEIWKVYREYAQQYSLFFIIKLDSNHVNHICIIMNYNNQYKHITVILNSLNLSLIYSTHVIVQRIHWFKKFTKIIEWLQRIM